MKRPLSLLFLFLAGAALLGLADNRYRASVEKGAVHRLQQAQSEVANRLQMALASRLRAVADLQAFMLAADDLPDGQTFDRFAAGMLDHYPTIRALAYVDSGRVIRRIYPLAGNEEALDLDLTTRPAAPFVEKAISQGVTTVNDPTTTVQGSLSVVARAPLYREETFLGLVQGVFDISALLDEALLGLSQEFVVQLVDAQGRLFWGPESLEGEGVSATIPVGDNTWLVTVGWAGGAVPRPQPLFLAFIWLAGGGLWISLLFIANRAWIRTEWLRRTVASRTEALAASEARLSHLLEATTEGIFLHDHGRILDANAAGAAMFGYTVEELIGKNVLELAHPSSVPTVRARVEAGSEEPYEATGLRRDGTAFPCELHVRNLTVSGQIVRATAIRDLTAQKEAMAALARSEERFRQFFLNEPNYCYMVSPEGIIVDVNPAAVQGLGYRRDELIGTQAVSLYAPEVRERAEKLFSQWGREGGLRDEELVVLTRQGERRTVLLSAGIIRDATGHVLHSVSVQTDITARLEAERAARALAEGNSQILRTTMDGYILADGQGQLLDVNPAYCQMIGYTREELLGMNINQLEASLSQAAIEARIQQMMAAGSMRFETRHRRKDGQAIELEVSAAIMAGPEGPLVAAFVRDITERKEAERALSESEARLSHLSQATHEGIILHDHGVILDVNESGLALTGYSRQELIGQNVLLLTHADSVPLVLEKIKSGSEQPYEAMGRRKDGSIFLCELRARTLSFQGREVRAVAVRDLTERVQAEQALRRYAGRLSILLAMDQAILQAQSPEEIAGAALERVHELVPCQRASVNALDLAAGEAIMLAIWCNGHLESGSGQRFSLEAVPEMVEQLRLGREIIVPDVEAVDRATPVDLAYRAEGLRAYLSLPLMAGEELVGNFNLAWQEAGRPGEEQVAIAREVAASLALAIQQNRLYQQVKRAAAELEQRVAERTGELAARTAETERLNREMATMVLDLQAANRRYQQAVEQVETANKELETFAYSASHDLKAPLRGIDGYSRLLLEDHLEQLNDEGRTFLHNIRQATLQMSQLIDDLLAYSRLERMPLQARRVDLPALVASLLAERAEELRQHGVAVSAEVPQATISADPAGLALALRNLLDNAVKFCHTVPQPAIEVGGRLVDGSCIIWVRDNGVGFDMKYHDRAFEIFQRLHRAEDYAGTGVGLAMVRKAMQRMGGRAWAESAPGQGATFYLELPR